jgi:Zn-dependent protease with chaperone function
LRTSFAHIERRDCMWFVIAGLLHAVFWVHPATHWAVVRLRHTAELASDDRAVEITGDPLCLARALVRVAGPMAAGWGAPMPAMARSASALFRRAKRLADTSDLEGSRVSRGSRRWAVAFQTRRFR